MRTFVAAVTLFSPVFMVSGAALSQSASAGTVTSSAYDLSAQLTWGGVSTTIQPVGEISGSSPYYDNSESLPAVFILRNLQTGLPRYGLLAVIAESLRTEAAFSMGVDTSSASASTEIKSLRLAGLPEWLSVSAAGLQSSASAFFGPINFGTPFAGDASFGSLSIAGTVVGGQTLTFSGDAAPDTVFYQTSTVTITLDEQVVTTQGITTTALDINFDNTPLLGQALSGDILIGVAFADPPVATPEPSGLLALLMPLFGLIAVRRSQSGRSVFCVPVHPHH